MAPLASGIKELVDEVLKRLPAELANAVIAYMDKVHNRSVSLSVYIYLLYKPFNSSVNDQLFSTVLH